MSDPGPEREPVTPWRTITLVFAFLLSLAACPCLGAGTPSEPDASDSERLLDDIVAGSDANFELIDHGRASYEATVTSKDPTGERTETRLYTIQFDYPLVRADMPDGVVIYKPDYVLHYLSDLGLPPESPTRPPGVVIQDPTIASHPPFHPRVQDGAGGRKHAGSIITAARGNPDGTLTAQRGAENVNIEVRYEHPSQQFRTRFVVAPQLGYSLTRIEQYALKLSESIPYRELTMSYRRLPSGAYLVQQRQETDRLWVGNEYSHTTETLTRLVDFDPARPSADIFRLESMGLPEGAHIDDQVHRRHYTFGSTAVTEDDIRAVGITGPGRGRTSRHVLVIGTLTIGMGVLWFGVIRRRFRR